MSSIIPLPKRLPDEHPRWYHRFCSWVKQTKQKRSVLAVYNAERQAKGQKPADNPPGNWRDKPARFNWVERVTEYDRLDMQRQIQALADRREEQRNRELEVAAALYKKGIEGLRIPLLTANITGADGRVTAIKGDPNAVRVGVQCLTTSSDQARRALEMVNTRVNIQELTDDELLRFIHLTEPGAIAEGGGEAWPAGEVSQAEVSQQPAPDQSE